MRDGWWWLSNPVFTVAVRIAGGQIVEGPPMVWKREANYTYDKAVFLGVQGELRARAREEV